MQTSSSRPARTPRPDQLTGIDFLRQAGRAILADEPGVGKTGQALLAAEGRTLVVSPALLSDVWETERKLWRPDLDLTWVSYNSLCASVRTAKGGTARLGVPAPELRRWWDTLIFDEAHALKGRHTKWADAGEALAQHVGQVFLLTGTPIPNWAHELYRPLRFVHPVEALPGKRLGSYWRWAGEWFQISMNKHTGQWSDVGDLLPHLDWESFARGNRLEGHWLRRTLEETVGLPPVTEQQIRVRMGEAQVRVYRNLKRDRWAEIEESGHEIISWTDGGVWTKLLKLSTGLAVEDPSLLRTGAHTASRGSKLAALVEFMAERDRPTIVFTLFRSSAEVAASLLRDGGHDVEVISGAYPVEDRQLKIKSFQAGQTQVLVGTLATLAEGVTLTEADCVVFLERDPRPSKREQAIRRIQRTGQTRPCLVVDLITEGSVDARLMGLIGSKTDQQMEAMRAIDLLAEE
jgi:SNF2 family DNA or RNA helicase